MILDSLQGASAEVLRAAAVIGLVAALIQTFFGYKLLKYMMTLLGFTVGLVLGFGVCSVFLKGGGSMLPVVIGTAVGFLMAFLAYRVYLLGAFLYCGVIAAGSVMLAFPPVLLGGTLRVIVCSAAFILAGILAVRYSRPYLVLLTAFTGSSSAVSSLQELAPELMRQSWYTPVIFFALAIMGAALQFLLTHEEKGKN